jgi:hypothetical protein
MRRSGFIAAAALAATLALLAGPAVGTFASPALAAPTADAVAFRSAQGDWVVHEQGGTYMYFALGVQVTRPHGRSGTFALIRKTKCAVAATKHIKVTVCEIGGKLHKIRDSAFSMDNLLAGAHLKVGEAKVVWKAADVPSPDAFPFASPYGAFVDAEVDRYARAHGRVLGTNLKTHNYADDALMAEGVQAYAFPTTLGPVHVSRTGRVHARFTYRTRR